MRGGNWAIGAELKLLGLRVDILLFYPGGVFHCCSGCRDQVWEGAGNGISFRSHIFLSEAGQSFWEVTEISEAKVRIGKDDFRHFRRHINKLND